VDDIVRHIVIARRDKDLVPLDPEMVPITNGGRTGTCKVGTRTGFGEAHGSGPLPLIHFWNKPLFKFLSTETLNEMGRPVGEAGRDVEGLGRPIHLIIDDNPHHVRESLPPIPGIADRRNPSVLSIVFQCFSKFRRAMDLSILKHDARLFPNLLEGRKDAPRKLDGLGYQHI